MDERKRNLLVGLFVLFMYFLSPELIGMIVPDINDANGAELFIRVVFYLIITSVAIYLFWNDIVKGFGLLKKDPKSFLKNSLIGTFILFVGVLLTSVVVQNLFDARRSINNLILNHYIDVALPFMLFNQLIYTPVVEEITFRGAFKNIIDNKYLYIIISAVAFGFFQVGYNISATQILYMIPWTVGGIIYAIWHLRTNNILMPVAMHLFYNLIYILVVL